jgi:iron complex transport system substrate-binding protein
MALARTLRGAMLVVVGALASTSCSSSQVPAARSAPTAASSHAFPLTLSDDEGVRVTVPSAPRRIVTFAPADTEIVFALGLGSRLVGVSYHQFDDYPPAATAIPEVGGPNTAPSIEKVVALHPDLLLATAGGQDWKGHLRQLGIPVFTTNATSFDDALHDIRTLGEVTGAGPAADRLAASMASQAAAIAQRVSAESGVSCFLDLGGFYTVGPNDFPFDLLRRAGCDPVTASATTSYPQWQKDELVKEDPAVYLFTSDSGDTVHGIESDAQLASIAAVTKGQVYSIDSDLISRPGPRLVQGITALARALHPNAFG